MVLCTLANTYLLLDLAKHKQSHLIADDMDTGNLEQLERIDIGLFVDAAQMFQEILTVFQVFDAILHHMIDVV